MVHIKKKLAIKKRIKDCNALSVRKFAIITVPNFEIKLSHFYPYTNVEPFVCFWYLINGLTKILKEGFYYISKVLSYLELFSLEKNSLTMIILF